LFRIIALLTGVLAFAAVAVSQAGPQENTQKMAEVNYVGHRSYPGFTRLVFDTGGVSPDAFKVNYDDAGKRVVFYPTEGTLAFTFAAVESVDDLVKDVDFVQSEDSVRGIAARLGEDASGCRVSFLSDPARLVLDIYKKTRPASFMPPGRPVKTVVLDPGHGGKSNGTGKPGVLTEKDLALDLAVRVRKLLARQGFKVVLTRDKDMDVTPDERAGIANNARADLYVSLHMGGSFGQDAGGVSIFTMDDGPLEGEFRPLAWQDQNAPYLPDSMVLARDLSASFGKLPDVKPDMRQARLAGVCGLSMPAVLVEAGNLSDPKQSESMADDVYRDKLAVLLAEGITRYAKEVNR